MRFVSKKKILGSLKSYYHDYKKWEVDDYVIGQFIATKTEMYMGKKQRRPILKVEEFSFANPIIDKEGQEVEIEGKNLQLNSAGAINYAFYVEDSDQDKEPIEKNEFVKVTFKGKMDAAAWKGEGQPPYQFEVETLEIEDEGQNDVDIF